MKTVPVGGKPRPYQFIVVCCEWPAAIDPPPVLRLTSTRDVEARQVRVPPPVFDTVIPSTGKNELLQLVSLMKYELRVSRKAFGRGGGVGVDRRGAVDLGVGLEVGLGCPVGVGARLAIEVDEAVGSAVAVSMGMAADRVGAAPCWACRACRVCRVCTAQKPSPAAAMRTLARATFSSAPLGTASFFKEVPPRTQERRLDVIS